jgi:hypothetical protein
MSLNSTSIKVSNSTATKLEPAFGMSLVLRSPRKPPAAPRVSESGERTKARPPPMEEGFRLVTEKEKKVEKLVMA